MKNFSRTTIAAAIILTACLSACVTWLYMTKDSKMPRIHKLKQPLMLSGTAADGQHYLLPAGTSLYYDQAFPEGFVRYKIYVNVEGVKLESTESTDKFWIDPLIAFPIDADSLKKLLRDYPLTREDVAAILGSGSLSKDEIRQLLLEYSR